MPWRGFSVISHVGQLADPAEGHWKQKEKKIRNLSEPTKKQLEIYIIMIGYAVVIGYGIDIVPTYAIRACLVPKPKSPDSANILWDTPR